MLLAVDIGNSNIKFGVFNGERLLSKHSLPTNSEIHANELRSVCDKSSITDAILCSVVPEKERILTRVLQDTFNIKALIVHNDVDFGLKINYRPLSAIGTDRLVNSFSAVEKYGPPAIVCSMGTATTFDVISKDRELLGGIIAPGMRTMATALHLNTAGLPEIEIEKPKNILGNTTVESMQSGAFYGHVSMIESLIERIRRESHEHARVIATGGFAVLVAENTRVIDVVDEDLLLNGLRVLYERVSPRVSR